MLSEQHKQTHFNHRMCEVMDTASLRGELRVQEPMSRHTTWKIGGNADYFYRPADIDDLSVFMSLLPDAMPVTWVGRGSNLLVRDGGIPGVVISVVGVLAALAVVDGNGLSVGAGVACVKAARFAARHSLGGIEYLIGIPGSMGGALAMNAGAYGGEVWQTIKQVATINRNGQRKTYSKTQFKIGYRSVSLPADEWFIGCDMELAIADKHVVWKNIKTILNERAEAQPLGMLSCGSVFRNPPNDYAARLIETSGLKGAHIGGASVSEKHANFIINMGHATATDLEQLIELIIETVHEKHAVKLIPEVRVMGVARRGQ